MKRLILGISIVLFLAGYIFAEEQDTSIKNSEESFLVVNSLIKNGLNKNFSQIQKESLNLTNSQRLTLYNLNENKFGVPLVLNLLLGFGIGSFVQGDTVGGVTGVLGDVSGMIILIVGMTEANYALDEYNKNIKNANTLAELNKASQDYDKKVEGLLEYYVTASVILGISRIVHIILPPVYSSRYNNKLQQALNYTNLAFDFTPVVDFDGNVKVTFAMTYKY